MIVECRRYTTSKLKQEDIAAVAYRIIDTQALGAIVVTPLGLQEGAEKIASAENIFSVKLDQNSTPTDFAMQFLNKFAIGASTTLFVKGEATYVLKNPDGTIEAEGKMQ